MFGFMKTIKRKAFTLTELLIALGIIGVLTAIVMPIIYNLAPDQNALMAKRAFYTTETAISDLLNDNFCYPKITGKVGLDDGFGYQRCKKWGGEENVSSRTNEDIAKKLVTLFADRLDIKGEISNSGSERTFKTKDGMTWTFSHFNLVANDPDSYVLLTVDVNGDKDPNCGQSNISGQCLDKKRTSGFDKFTMRIFARGRVQIIDCWAILAARTDKKLVGKEAAVCNDQDSGAKNDECTEEPTGPEDFCCNDPKHKDKDICNPCTSSPTSAEDYCCTKEGSPWIGTEACDPCSYTKPSSYTDECCDEGHKWHGTSVCNVCAQPYSVDCCLTKLTSIAAGDRCCDHDEVKSRVPACSNQSVIISPKFYVSSQKPKDSSNWGNTKITAETKINESLPFDIAVKYIRSCPNTGVGCSTYGQGMTCTIPAGTKSCIASEEFVSGSFAYKFELNQSAVSQGGFSGFKPSTSVPAAYQNSYSVKFNFPSKIDMY